MSSRGVQYNRTPCPARVFEDLGNGFAMGCMGGSLWYFIKGKDIFSLSISIKVLGMQRKDKEYTQGLVMLGTELHFWVEISGSGVVFSHQ